ncbi:GrlR family regulatory protein [Bradyrhizobium sp. AZCC 1721]|uniref:GrlR family regulatory protein n=1 Tax=Bradyrhizobium sp. AZCC 1721 TaxID=3117016 RepID=UPI002FEFC3BA
MLQGLYKFRFTTARGTGSGVMFATSGGRLYGGDSGSSFVGHFTETDGIVSCEVTMSRHYHDPKYVPMFEVEHAVMNFRGAPRGEEFHFEGSSVALPGVYFTTILSPIDDTDAPPPGAVGPDGIGNGLYSIHIRMLDGIDAGNTGVMMLQDGRIRGGDAFFDYVGAYTAANGRWKGELINREHTPAMGERPVFGGHEVGIGFSGTYDRDSAEGEATALVGKRSIRFKAVLRKLVEVEG